ncbi:GlsB/YeaQ/YmgE family stress response membrane protein [Pseudooceanicola sp. LIPI14-2-Ac024]|uniref:GlsB/YeaQ/YmgE family stress response membrane protein n=1 Tax=Pseudooceanicola sp. LIPI14-2-Ac024 TaxID=3344875 RepID=UPI0035CFF4B7
MDTTTAAADTNWLMGLLITIIIGAIVGWLAGVIMKGGGSGLIMNVILGICGSFVGGWLLPLIGISWGGFWGSFFMALIGAIILILVFRLLRPGPG